MPRAWACTLSCRPLPMSRGAGKLPVVTHCRQPPRACKRFLEFPSLFALMQKDLACHAEVGCEDVREGGMGRTCIAWCTASLFWLATCWEDLLQHCHSLPPSSALASGACCPAFLSDHPPAVSTSATYFGTCQKQLSRAI